MTIQVLEWLIDCLGVVSGLLLGSRRRSGWLFTIAAQTVWCVVAVLTHQWAFVAASVIYGVVAIRGWMTWRGDTRRPQTWERAVRCVLTEDEADRYVAAVRETGWRR